jgi:pyruvate formate lyase activating enzyme
MNICGLEKMSLVDYDGLVASTVFTGGCNFKCGFCHNSALVINANNLQTIPEEEVISYLKKRVGIVDGLCVSGGEPTLQKDLPNFLEKVKEIGLKIKLDTNGTRPDLIKYFHQSGLVDYFAMDIKNDKDNYAKIIGFDSYNTLKVEQSVEYFLKSNADYEFRTTLISEYHSIENIKAIAEWIKGAKKYFLQKFRNGENCILTNLNEVPLETAKEYLKILSPYIQKVSLRSY